MNNLHKPTADTLVLCVVLLLAGCSKSPPSANTKTDVRRLPVATDDLRARSLPDEDVVSLSRLRNLRTLDFWSGYGSYPIRFTDRGLAVLASLDLPRLELLFFGHCTNVTDASLDEITKMRTVRCLKLVACPGITDAGLRKLVGMTNLTFLDLRGCTNITDRGVENLASRTNWQAILLGGCPHVSVDAVKRLHRRVPGGDVEKDDKEWSWHK